MSVIVKKYDTAQICENGHIITIHFDTEEHERKNFCPQCSAPTIIKCPYCHSKIQGGLNETHKKLTSFNIRSNYIF